MSRHHPHELSAKQEQAIAALLAYPTVREAAEAVKVTERTVWNWLASPAFKAAYEAERALLLQEVKNGWTSLAREAHEGIRALLKDSETPAQVKLKAYLTAIERLEALAPAAKEKGANDGNLTTYMTPDELALLETLIAAATARKLAREIEVHE